MEGVKAFRFFGLERKMKQMEDGVLCSALVSSRERKSEGVFQFFFFFGFSDIEVEPEERERHIVYKITTKLRVRTSQIIFEISVAILKT